MSETRSVLVTGAGGFIGGRVVEVLHRLGDTPVRAGVRRWASAARIGRLPVEIVQCDVMDPASLDRALNGISAVVHCAVGDRDVTVEGTEKLLKASERAGVDRVVHISTIDVYGDATGEVSEQTPLRHTGNPYGDSKIDAEAACRAAIERGVPVAILRPTLVYGPFSESWTIEWAQRLQARPWLLSEDDCRGTCNLVYVDDLVGAIRLAIASPEAAGESFNINGPDRPTWNDYFRALNDAMGLPALVTQSAATSHASAHVMAPVRASAKWLIANFEGPIMGLYQRSALAKRVMRGAEGLIRKTPNHAEFALLAKSASFPTAKAGARLGYQPSFAMAEGIELSVAWLRHHGYLAQAAETPR